MILINKNKKYGVSRASSLIIQIVFYLLNVSAALDPTFAPTPAPNNAPIFPPSDPMAVKIPVKKSFNLVLRLIFTNSFA